MITSSDFIGVHFLPGKETHQDKNAVEKSAGKTGTRRLILKNARIDDTTLIYQHVCTSLYRGTDQCLGVSSILE